MRSAGYVVAPGQHVELAICQADGGRAVLVGTIDAVPLAAWGGMAMRLRISAEQIRALPAEKQSGARRRARRR